MINIWLKSNYKKPNYVFIFGLLFINWIAYSDQHISQPKPYIKNDTKLQLLLVAFGLVLVASVLQAVPHGGHGGGGGSGSGEQGGDDGAMGGDYNGNMESGDKKRGGGGRGGHGGDGGDESGMSGSNDNGNMEGGDRKRGGGGGRGGGAPSDKAPVEGGAASGDYVDYQADTAGVASKSAAVKNKNNKKTAAKNKAGGKKAATKKAAAGAKSGSQKKAPAKKAAAKKTAPVKKNQQA